MSKGFLYDTGDELITREDVAGLPVPEAGDIGGTAIVSEKGWEIKPKDLYIPAAYDRENHKIAFASGYKISDIKNTVAKGGNVYLVLRSSAGGQYDHVPYGAGSILKINYSFQNVNYLALYNVILAFVVSEGVSQTITFGSYSSALTGLIDADTGLNISIRQDVVISLS